jgi:hypothetical protein
MECDYWPVDEERMRRESAERAERCGAELRQRLDGIERRWAEGEKARRREWEELEGRQMTAIEEHRLFNDGLFRKMTVMTNEYIKILREEGEALRDHRVEIAERRGQLRANTEAVLKALDRLPPSQTE